MKKLISMTDFILQQKQSESIIEKQFINEELLTLEKIRNYAKFLKQPLKLEMFVPADENGNVLNLPIAKDYYEYEEHLEALHFYRKAKEKVLFKGFPVKINQYKDKMYHIGWESYNPSIFIKERNKEWEIGDFETIEDLLSFSKEIELTESAIKQINN